MREAEADVRRALQLAPQLPEAHYAMGLVHAFGHEDTKAALSQFRKAIGLRPSYADAVRMVVGSNSSTRATWSTVSRNSSMPSLLDPNSADYASELARALLIRGNFEASRRMWRRTIALAPNDIQGYGLLSDAIFHQTGDRRRH